MCYFINYIPLADGHQPYKRLYTMLLRSVDEFETRMPCVIIVIDLSMWSGWSTFSIFTIARCSGSWHVVSIVGVTYGVFILHKFTYCFASLKVNSKPAFNNLLYYFHDTVFKVKEFQMFQKPICSLICSHIESSSNLHFHIPLKPWWNFLPGEQSQHGKWILKENDQDTGIRYSVS